MNREDAISMIAGELRKANGEIRRQVAENVLQKAEKLVREEKYSSPGVELKGPVIEEICAAQKARECPPKPAILGVDPGSPEGLKAIIAILRDERTKQLCDTGIVNPDFVDAVILSFAMKNPAPKKEWSDAAKRLLQGLQRTGGFIHERLERQVEVFERNLRTLERDDRVSEEEKEELRKFAQHSLARRVDALHTATLEKNAIKELIDNP